jgi:hypothetical protein
MIPPIGRAGKPLNMGRLSSGYTIGGPYFPFAFEPADGFGAAGQILLLTAPIIVCPLDVRRKHMK